MYIKAALCDDIMLEVLSYLNHIDLETYVADNSGFLPSPELYYSRVIKNLKYSSNWNIKTSIKAGCFRMFVFFYSNQTQSDQEDEKLISLAARNGQLQIVDFLMKCMHSLPGTLMDDAIISGSLELVKHLYYLQIRCDFTNAIDLACAHNSLDIVKFLLSVGRRYSYNAFIYAIGSPNAGILKCLFDDMISNTVCGSKEKATKLDILHYNYIESYRNDLFENAFCSCIDVVKYLYEDCGCKITNRFVCDVIGCRNYEVFVYIIDKVDRVNKDVLMRACEAGCYSFDAKTQEPNIDIVKQLYKKFHNVVNFIYPKETYFTTVYDFMLEIGKPCKMYSLPDYDEYYEDEYAF
jgi:hypothetical protein